MYSLIEVGRLAKSTGGLIDAGSIALLGARHQGSIGWNSFGDLAQQSKRSHLAQTRRLSAPGPERIDGVSRKMSRFGTGRGGHLINRWWLPPRLMCRRRRPVFRIEFESAGGKPRAAVKGRGVRDGRHGRRWRNSSHRGVVGREVPGCRSQPPAEIYIGGMRKRSVLFGTRTAHRTAESSRRQQSATIHRGAWLLLPCQPERSAC